MVHNLTDKLLYAKLIKEYKYMCNIMQIKPQTIYILGENNIIALAVFLHIIIERDFEW